MSDEIILVNLADQETGFCEKLEAHRIPSLHRAFSVFLYRQDPISGEFQMLLQKRAEGKYHSGGLWTNACCSHPRRGESLEEAVPRRMREELGIVPKVQELFSFVYYHRFSDSCAEFEYDHVFCGLWTGEAVPNPEEISELQWISLSELERWMLKQPDVFSPWFLIAAPKVLQLIQTGTSA